MPREIPYPTLGEILLEEFLEPMGITTCTGLPRKSECRNEVSAPLFFEVGVE
jgi:hypothetical protein